MWRRQAERAAGLGISVLRSLWRELLERLGLAGATLGAQRTDFTIALVALAAKMAKADGVAVPVEAVAFARCFEIAPSERPNIERLFNLAKRDVMGYEAYAANIARLLRDHDSLLRDVFECLFHVAAADGILHEAEEKFLHVVAGKFGLSQEAFHETRRLFVRDVRNPYDILGVPPSSDAQTLKARYHTLVKQHHPDRLAANGVPASFRAQASRKLAVINAAYDDIKKSRKRGGRE